MTPFTVPLCTERGPLPASVLPVTSFSQAPPFLQPGQIPDPNLQWSHCPCCLPHPDFPPCQARPPPHPVSIPVSPRPRPTHPRPAVGLGHPRPLLQPTGRYLWSRLIPLRWVPPTCSGPFGPHPCRCGTKLGSLDREPSVSPSRTSWRQPLRCHGGDTVLVPRRYGSGLGLRGRSERWEGCCPRP